jgi:hypothetical protein
MIGGDLDSLERLFADDMAYTHSSSLFDDKAGYIQAMREAKFAYKTVERSEAKVAFAGGAAIMTGRIRVGVMFDTRPARTRQPVLERVGEGGRTVASPRMAVDPHPTRDA